ncbi:unnamed protein product [Trichobilharzia szidati]|nr:unnamed protein product [Trichobilharzia szidati]
MAIDSVVHQGPNSSKSLSVKSNDVPQSLSNTPLSKPESNFGDEQPVASTPIGRLDSSRQTRSVFKLGQRSVELKADSHDIKSGSITMSPLIVNENEIINSPASDITEPMTYAERVELLRIPFLDASDVKVVTFKVGHFCLQQRKLWKTASAALRSLPSSPSSLDSSLFSSSVSTPKIPPEDPLATKSEVNETKSDNTKHDIFRSNQASNKSLFPNPCIQTTVDTNLPLVISPNHVQPSPVVSCIITTSTTYRSLPSPIQPAGVGPPPLLSLSNKLTEQKSCVPSYSVTSKENECVPVLPPTLMPVRVSRRYGTREPTVISHLLLKAACYAQGPKEEAGKIARVEGIQFNTVESLALNFQNILRIENLNGFTNLTKLQLNNNIIEKIENLDGLVNLTWLGNCLAEKLKDELTESESETFDSPLFVVLYCFSFVYMTNENKKIIIIIALKVMYLRKFDKLESVNLSGNPLTNNQSYIHYTCAFVPQLQYLDYKKISQTVFEEAYLKYQLTVDQLREKEKEQKAKQDELDKKMEDRKVYAAAFIDDLEGDRLFEIIMEADPDGQKFVSLPLVAEVLDQYPFHKRERLI